MKKQQVIFINGWDSKSDYKNFEDYVRKTPYSPKYQNFIIWWKSLYKNLWDSFEVLSPDMPNRDYAEYKYWKIRFEQVLPYVNDDVIFVAHSLWGGFLAKYLNENKFNKQIKHIFIVSWTFKDWKYLLGDFNFDKQLLQFKKYENIVTFYHSIDDDIVAYSDMLDFKKVLPNAKYKIFQNRWHFIEERFIELENDIKSIINKD